MRSCAFGIKASIPSASRPCWRYDKTTQNDFCIEVWMRGKQLSFKTMGGETVSHPVRGKHYVQPRGYAHHPGTGPAGETCRSCQHRIQFRRWNKCDLARGKWTGGRASDIL